MCVGGDSLNEDDLMLCCALCCINCALYPSCEAIGFSGKAGLCCLNLECCCKPGGSCLFPFGCVGINCVNNECAIVNAQCHLCCAACSTAIPCNDEVPAALTILGLTIYPTCGCCLLQKEIMER